MTARPWLLTNFACLFLLLIFIHSPGSQSSVAVRQVEMAAGERQIFRSNPTAYYTEIKILRASDAQMSDNFCYVAIDNDTIVVGAPLEDGGQGDPLLDAGAVYVFKRDQGGMGNWGEVARLTASDAESFDYFGSSVAIDGNTIVVGAPEEDGGPGNPQTLVGAAYIFEPDPGNPGSWFETKKISASDVLSGAYFGSAVAISNNTIVIGAYGADGNPSFPSILTGAVYVFERDIGGLGNWGETKKIVASDAEEADYFGYSVSIYGDTAVVGARFADGVSAFMPNAGAAYFFDRNLGGTNNWGESTRLGASDSQVNDQFGNSVAIDGDFAVIGALGEDGGPGDPLPDAGAAYVIERGLANPGSWTELTKLTASDAHAGDFFGRAVALDGINLVVGARGEDGGPGDPTEGSGIAYIFQHGNPGQGNWSEVFRLTASDAEEFDGFGLSVDIDGELLVVGAPGEDGGPGDPLPDAGAVYVFKEIVLSEQIFLPFISR